MIELFFVELMIVEFITVVLYNEEFSTIEAIVMFEFSRLDLVYTNEFVTDVFESLESLICEFVELEFVRLELYTNEFVSIMESDAFELLNNES